MKKKLNYKLGLAFSAILFLAIFNFGFGNDYYWHIKAGEYIVTNLKIPYYDIFSWYGISNHLYWMSHEWLSEVILYLYNIVFKNFGPLMFNLTIYGGLIFILFSFNQEKMKKNYLFTLLWSLIGFLIFSRVMLPRPHMISYILLAFTVYVLYDNFYHKNSRKIYFLPLITLLWSNFHGGSSNLPYILSFIFLICGLFQFKFGKLEANKISREQIKKYLICGILSILVIAINPHGIKMISYPYINMQDDLMISSISEWASPSLNHVSDYGDFLLLGIVILIMIITNKKIKVIDFVILGAFLVLGFKSLKFIPLLYIASTFIIFNFIGEYKFSYEKYLTMAILIIAIVSGILFVPKLMNSYTKKPLSDEIIKYIKEQNPNRLFNFYDYGGYLIYNDIKVFIDGRADMYSKYNFRDAMELQDRGYDYLLDGYNFDMFVLPNNIALTIHLANNNKYQVTKQIDNVVIYEKVITE